MVERRTWSNRLFDLFNILFLAVVGGLCLYPMLHVLFGSFSNPQRLFGHQGLILWPLGFITKGYEIVLNNPNIWIGYGNTLFYVTVGTVMRTFMTMLGAYVLYQKDFMPRRFLMALFVVTMYFGGGLIPDYLLVRQLGLLNTRWAIIVPSLIATWNMIILRTAFSQTPAALAESARLDGAGDLTVLLRILAPSNKAAIAVIIMYYAVGEWNSWFTASVYLTARRDLFPLQLFLRETLISYSQSGNMSANTSAGFSDMDAITGMIDDVVRYCTIIVATVPILCVYPYVQKFFIKGVMLGSLKE